MLKQTKVELRKYIARKGLFTRIPIPYKLKTLEPEISLGRAILDRALLDCMEDETIIDWFDVQNTDFNTICYIAYLDPIQVVKRFEIILKRLQGREYLENIMEELPDEQKRS